MPYYRQYHYSNLKASGTFTEINGLLNYYKYNYIQDDINKGIQESWGAGFGVAVGYKYVSKSNWIFEVLLGGGFNTLYFLYPRTGILIGKRF